MFSGLAGLDYRPYHMRYARTMTTDSVCHADPRTPRTSNIATWLTSATAARSAVRDALAGCDGLASQADLAKRWRVSRQRVHQLISEPSFPEPVTTVNDHPVWLAAEADTWHENRALMRAQYRCRDLLI